jgi:branched-chain amino acid transport system permease protein
VVVKNVASAYIERWNFVLGAIFVMIMVFMPEGLVPGLGRLARRLRVGASSQVPAVTATREEVPP